MDSFVIVFFLLCVAETKSLTPGRESTIKLNPAI